MKFRKLASTILLSSLVLGVTGCSGGSDDNTIVVGASATPHAEVLEAVRDIIEEAGYELEIEIFTDYILPNKALSEGSLDANFFQHVPYLQEEIENFGYDLEYTESILITPMSIYSENITDVSEVKEGDQIAIPNDATNGGRALEVLAYAGLIELADVELKTVADITSNPLNLEIIELDAYVVPTVLQDVACAVINTNIALSSGLDPQTDSIATQASYDC